MTGHRGGDHGGAQSPRLACPGQTDLPVPSHHRRTSNLDTPRCRRGPLWINVNWMLRRVMRLHGYPGQVETSERDAAADPLRRALRVLAPEHRRGHRGTEL